MSKYSIEFIAEMIKKARQSKGLSQRALSAMVGIPQSHLSKIESKHVDLQASSLVEISRALELELLLIPRALVPTVLALLRNTGKSTKPRPMYHLDEENIDEE